MSVLQSIFTVDNLLMMNIGLAVGIIIGAMPGLSVAFAVTVLMTMTFHMESLPAMYLLLGAYCGGMYGGSITATLINTPGTANAVCTALEGYPLARKGRAGDSLKCALVASTIGGLFSCVALSFFAPQLAKVILKIGSPEYFALCTFGGAEAAMIAYNESKRASKHPEEYGNGSIEGILAAEAANNAVTGGAMIPMLTLGIPGDTVMAILLSALTMQSITPGANLFSSGSFWVYAIMGGLFLINIFMFIQGSACIRLFAQVSKIPQSIMTPCIVVMCMMGAFAINNNIFECFVMIAFGLIGFFMKGFGFPVTPLCIALVLGKLFETNLRRSLILSSGNPFVFVTRPISCAILILAVFMLFFPILSNMVAEKRMKSRK